MAYHRHLPRIKDSSGVNRYKPYVWNGSAWVEHPSYIDCEKTNMWLYNNGDENTEITGGWISEGCYMTPEMPSDPTPLGLTKNATNMVITNNNSAPVNGPSGIVHIADDVDMTPYSVLRIKCDYNIRNCTARIHAMKKGSTYWGEFTASVDMPAYSSATGAELTIDVSSLTGAYDVCIGMVAWASQNSVTVYEIELR